MGCCADCFADDFIKEYIDSTGDIETCDFCEKENVKCVDPEDLQKLFLPVINLYSRVEDYLPSSYLKEGSYGDSIDEILTWKWGIFDNSDAAKRLLEAIFPRRDKDDNLIIDLDASYGSRDKFLGTSTIISDKMTNEWEKFCKEIKYENRFFPNNVLNTEDFYEILEYFTIRPIETVLYRARICDNANKYGVKEMGKPSVEKSVNGRVNPIGIPCLYLSSDKKTAICEVRPSVGNKITVGTFSVFTPLNLIDLRNPTIDSPFEFRENLSFVIDYVKFLVVLGAELSKPIIPQASSLEYIPTQYLCELIKREGYEGVIYRSSQSDGYNVAIFEDEEKVDCIDTELYQVNSSEYGFSLSQ